MMYRLTEKHDRVLDDLRIDIEDSDEDWENTVSAAMEEAWDRLMKLGAP